jgi:hypothetical protein
LLASGQMLPVGPTSFTTYYRTAAVPYELPNKE